MAVNPVDRVSQQQPEANAPETKSNTTGSNTTGEPYGDISEEACSEMIAHNNTIMSSTDYEALLRQLKLKDGYGISRDPVTGMVIVAQEIVNHKKSETVGHD